jgi:putative tryptophan/tyrosine transport system substrate-binding protein
MRRRDFIAALGGAAGWPFAARAQQSAMPVVGLLDFTSTSQRPDAGYVAEFRQGLAAAGFVEGRTVTIVYRWANYQMERLAPFAADLVQGQVAVIVAIDSGPTILAAKAATSTIPIVFALAADPIKFGLVASLNRPGSNMTGISGRADLPLNQLETRLMQSAARTLGLRLLVFNLAAPFQSREAFGTEITQVFATLVEQRAGAVLMGGSLEIFFTSNEILSHAARFALPTMCSNSIQARAGGLLSYGAPLSEFTRGIRQLGVYTGRILKGEKPGDLPVIQNFKIEFVINLKTAKALGLTIPTNLLVRADEVIE